MKWEETKGLRGVMEETIEKCPKPSIYSENLDIGLNRGH